MSGYLLGYDVGSSSVKASVIDSGSGAVIASATSPDKELPISAPEQGWAEQHPDMWWEHVVKATGILKNNADFKVEDIKAIGISYQMHGLVMVDNNMSVLYPSIIWCDSRAVETGNKAFNDIGPDKCLEHLLNSPGNFTASKLAWVKKNLPDIYGKVHKIMLPGDFIAYKMTGSVNTTPSGLSEGIIWDFKDHSTAKIVLDYYGIPESFIPEIKPTFSVQGELTDAAAIELGLKSGIPVSYRAGDQPNNALSLNVLEPGEIAATAGTSGVVYGVGDKANYDKESRVNTFVHVNYSKDKSRYGTLLCVNGTGILNSWMKHNVASADYDEMNSISQGVKIGSDGLCILPFGNGAERSLGNKNINASVHGLNFNIHTKAHMLRAAQEGIVFALNYGLEIMRNMGISINKVRAGYANMFLSPVFGEAFATVTNAAVELYNTDGSQGAARGAGIGAGIYKDAKEAFGGLKVKKVIEPDKNKVSAYSNAYSLWNDKLKMYL
jgi:xylulokinase